METEGSGSRRWEVIEDLPRRKIGQEITVFVPSKMTRVILSKRNDGMQVENVFGQARTAKRREQIRRDMK